MACVTQADLGHIARWLERIMDPRSNDLEHFLDYIYVVYPLPKTKISGVIFVDPPGFGDPVVLRTYRANRAVKDAEVMILMTSDGVGQSIVPKNFLKPYWEVSLTSQSTLPCCLPI